MNSSPDNQHFILEQKEKVFENLVTFTIVALVTVVSAVVHFFSHVSFCNSPGRKLMKCTILQAQFLRFRLETSKNNYGSVAPATSMPMIKPIFNTDL